MANNDNSWDLDAMLSQEIQDLNRDSAEDRRVKEAVIMSKPDPNRIDANDSDEEYNPGVDNYYYPDDDDEYEDDLAIRDPELFKITESNRQIAIDCSSKSSDSKHKLTRRPSELVFSDPPVLISKDNYIQVTFHYGLSEEKKTGRCKRYMMMCDFGEESMYAMRWGIGTLLRSGDELHIASVVDTDEDVEDMNEDGRYRLWGEVTSIRTNICYTILNLY